jgi:hypothetical protein
MLMDGRTHLAESNDVSSQLFTIQALESVLNIIGR